MSIRFLFAALVMSGAVSSWAQSVPEQINYQMRIAQGTNLPSGAQSVVFRLFSASTGGTQFYQETQTVTAVEGLLATAIGASNAVPGALSSAFTNAAVFLELVVNGETLSPRERLIAVPFAFNAERLAGVPASSYATTNHQHDLLYVNEGQTNSITAPMLAAGLVSNAALAANAVLSSNILDGTIAAVDLATGSVGNGALLANAVTGDKIADGTVSNADLAAGAVGTASLAANVVTGDKVVDGTISNADLAASSITAVKIAGGAIGNAAMAANAVASSNVIDGTLVSIDFAAASVTNATLAPNAVTGDKIADGTVSNADLAAGAVGTANLAANVVTGDKVVDGTISNADLAASSITSVKIAGGAIGNAAMAANAVASSNVIDGTLVSIDFAAASVTNATLAPNAVTGDKIADGTISNADIAATAAITASKIADGAGSGLDADLLDGLSSASFLRSDVSDTFGGAQLTMRTNSTIYFSGSPAQGAIDGLNLRLRVGGSTADEIYFVGRVAMGSTNVVGTNTLEVTGQAAKTGGGSWATLSDARTKTDVAELDHALGTIGKLRPVSFHYSKDYIEKHPAIPDRLYHNFIAQEFQQVFPQDVEASSEGFLYMDGSAVVPYLVKAVQELEAQNRALQARLEAVEKRNGAR